MFKKIIGSLKRHKNVICFSRGFPGLNVRRFGVLLLLFYFLRKDHLQQVASGVSRLLCACSQTVTCISVLPLCLPITHSAVAHSTHSSPTQVCSQSTFLHGGGQSIFLKTTGLLNLSLLTLVYLHKTRRNYII